MRDLVVYVAGGGMRGIFGAGALNAAHFALGSAMQAMEWYLHYVPAHRILAHGFWLGYRAVRTERDRLMRFLDR